MKDFLLIWFKGKHFLKPFFYVESKLQQQKQDNEHETMLIIVFNS